MADAVCPERVLKTAIDLLETMSSFAKPDDQDRILENIDSLSELREYFSSRGITWIKSTGEDNSAR